MFEFFVVFVMYVIRLDKNERMQTQEEREMTHSEILSLKYFVWEKKSIRDYILFSYRRVPYKSINKQKCRPDTFVILPELASLDKGQGH